VFFGEKLWDEGKCLPLLRTSGCLLIHENIQSHNVIRDEQMFFAFLCFEHRPTCYQISEKDFLTHVSMNQSSSLADKKAENAERKRSQK
jgi:hypothetical protein